MKVLVFDDDQSIGNLLRCFLSSKGHDVTVFKEPNSCPLYLSGECTCPMDSPCADVIFIDYNMPKLTGLELIRHQERIGCKLRTANKALMSVYLSPTDIKGLRAKGYQVVSKSFNMNKILHFMDECQQRLAKASEDIH